MSFVNKASEMLMDVLVSCWGVQPLLLGNHFGIRIVGRGNKSVHQPELQFCSGKGFLNVAFGRSPSQPVPSPSLKHFDIRLM